MTQQLRIVIADDHPIFQRGLAEVLETDPGIVILGKVNNGVEALELITRQLPDVAILDIDMPHMNGLEVAEKLRSQEVRVPIVILTMYKEEDMFNEAMDLGVMGYVLKENAVSDILTCVHTVVAGKHFISPLISNFLLNRRERSKALEEKNPGLRSLTPAERRVLSLIAEGKTSKEIAGALFVSHRTIENHRANICIKLNLKGSYALLKFAIENKGAL
jgi:DNA-binding NarL/FixJ family response regulator